MCQIREMAVMRILRAAAAGGRVAIAVVALYLSLLTGAAWWWRLRATGAGPNAPAGPQRRFAILIPAHDEERLIGRTLQSLANQDYPPERFDVHVVADNCTDATAVIARTSGVAVHERTDPDAPGKGPALQWLIGRLGAADETYDAYVFLDADTTAEPGVLAALDRAMAGGARAVQAHYRVRDEEAGPVVAFRAASFAARNYLRPLGRTAIGGTAGLLGNGMAFDPATLRARSWTDHLTEDAELQLELLRDGITVAFAADACVAAEMPDTLEAAQSQHDRWEQGRLDLAKRHVPGLLQDAVRGGPAGRIAPLDGAVDMLVPPFSIVVAASGGWATVAAARWLLRPSAASRRDLIVAVAVVGSQVCYVLSALRMVEAPPAVYRSLLGAPRMVAWKSRQWLRVLVRPRDDGWIRTARNPQ